MLNRDLNVSAIYNDRPFFHGASASPFIIRIWKYTLIALAIITIILFWGVFQKLHADDQVISGTKPQLVKDPDFKPRLGTYYYCFEYNSMNLGTAWVSITREGDFHRMEVSARTSDTIDYIYRIRYRGVNFTDLDPLSPLETRIQQQVRSNEKDIVMRFQQNGNVKTTQKYIEKGVIVDGTVRNFHAEKFTTDPFSATYLARGLEWKPGLEQIFEVYNGKKRYELNLKCTGRTAVEMPGGKRDAWVIVPSAKEIEDDGRKVELKKRPSSMKIYLSADELKDVLRIEASHTIGSFLVLLDRFEPAAKIAVDG